MCLVLISYYYLCSIHDYYGVNYFLLASAFILSDILHGDARIPTPDLEGVTKHLVKRLNTEGQSPELAKGEVVLRKEILSLGEEALTLKSHENVYVRSDEITLKQQRDLGVFTNYFSGQHHSSFTAQSQDESSSDIQEAAAHSFMDTLPQSLDNLTVKNNVIMLN